MMGPFHGARITWTWRLQTFSCGGMSSHLCMDIEKRMKPTSDRSPRPLHRSLRKCCARRLPTCQRGTNCAASTVAAMFSVNVLGHESGVPPTRVCTTNFYSTFSFIFVRSQTDHHVVMIKLKSVASVRKRTMSTPTERSPLVGEVSGNCLRI
jgi:hypothetical protein